MDIYYLSAVYAKVCAVQGIMFALNKNATKNSFFDPFSVV